MKISFLQNTLLFTLFFMNNIAIYAQQDSDYISDKNVTGSFVLANKNKVAAIYIDANNHKGVIRAAHDLENDLQKVTDI